MSDNEANPGTEGTNAQPPVAGHTPHSGTEGATPAAHQPGYPAVPQAPAPAPGVPTPATHDQNPASSPYPSQAGYGQPGHDQVAYDAANPWARPSDAQPGQPAQPAQPQQPGQPPQPGQAPSSYTVQLPPSYNPGTAYSQPNYGQPTTAQPGYPSSSYTPGSAAPYGASTGGTPVAGSTPSYTGQTWTGMPGTAPTDPGPRRPAAWRRTALAAVAAAALALVAGGVGGFVGYAMHPDDGSPVQNVSQSDPKNAAPVIDRSSLASIAKAIQPTVVSVKTQSGEGSGVVISADGYIVTNNHVVATATGSTVQVTFNSGKVLQAKIVGTDPKTDIAVVKVDATGLTAAAWADSDSVQVGDTVLAIGSPLGLQGSVTAGIVSALHRTIQESGDDQQSPFGQQQQAPSAQTTIGDAIQTDAPINPGNSGGALVDTNGKVVGINSAIATSGSGASGNIGVGFAISANKAKSVSDQLIKGGKVSHPYLGVSVGEAQNGGAQIQSVEPGSPAANAGIQEGDVITKVGDRTITTSDELVGAIQASSPGTKMSLTVERNGSSSQVTATVGDQP